MFLFLAERERESSEQELLVINFNQNVMNIEEIKQNVMVAQERKKSYRKWKVKMLACHVAVKLQCAEGFMIRLIYIVKR